MIGFGNFSDYQDRKEFFIDGHKPYEDELVRLALNESLTKKNMISLEARICPKNTSAKLIKNLKKYECIVKSESVNDGYDKLIYVLHFPKMFDDSFKDGVPRNNNVRKMAARQARSIVAMLDKNGEINQHIKGIDAWRQRNCMVARKLWAGIPLFDSKKSEGRKCFSFL